MKNGNSIYALNSNKSPTIYNRIRDFMHSEYDVRFNEIDLDYYISLKNKDVWEKLNLDSLVIKLNQVQIQAKQFHLSTYLKSDLTEKYNPIKDYFVRLNKWDGVDYIRKYLEYVDFKDTEEAVLHFKKWAARAVKCALDPHYINKQCIVLIQNEQNTGKTTWIRNLCPPNLQNYIAEDIGLDKDSRILLCKNLIINLDELNIQGKTNINSLKSQMSKTFVNERLPYEKKNTQLSRVASFIASTNDTGFLSDGTGSVRWLCFEIEGRIDFSYSQEFNINNFWRQAYYLAYHQGDINIELDAEEINKNEIRNQQFYLQTTEYELIDKYGSRSNEIDDFKTSTEIALILSRTGVKTSAIQIGKALSALGYQRIKHSKRQAYGYIIKISRSQKKVTYLPEIDK